MRGRRPESPDARWFILADLINWFAIGRVRMDTTTPYPTVPLKACHENWGQIPISLAWMPHGLRLTTAKNLSYPNICPTPLGIMVIKKKFEGL